MNSNDLILAKKAQNMENRLIMDYSNAVITVENKDLMNEIVSVLNEKIIGKENVSFIIENSDNEKFGYYINNE